MSRRNQTRAQNGEQRKPRTISATDQEWELITQEADKRRVSKSRLLMDLVKQQKQVSHTQARPLRNWFSYGEIKQPLGRQMWICDPFPQSFHFLDVPEFYEAKIRRRSWAKWDFERHLEESREYHQHFRQHVLGTQGFQSRAIYSEVDMGEIVNGYYSHLDSAVRIDALEAMKEFYEEHYPDNEVTFIAAPKQIRLDFRIHELNDGSRWAYLFGDRTYFSTADHEIIRGLLEEFSSLFSEGATQGQSEAIGFLKKFIDDIKAQE